MAHPIITLQMAFGSSPGAASYTWTTVHEDPESGAVREMSYRRGRQNELARMQAGIGSVVLRDPDSDFDPGNSAGRYYPNVRPYVPVRARATIAGVTYDLFQHYLERAPRTRRILDTYAERSITTVDGFEWLARAGLSGATYAQELTSVRVANVLNDIGWSSTLRNIGTGQDTIAAATYVASDEVKALSHLLDVAEWENGLLFIDASGRVAFVGRHSLISSPYTVSQVTLRDAAAGGGGYLFVESQPSYDLDSTFNEWSGTRTGGVTQTVSDATSKGLYGERSKQFSSGVTSDLTVMSQAEWKLAQFKNPLDRVESITVMPGDDTAFWQAVLGLEIGERITVKEKAPGFTSVTSDDYVIQNIEARFPSGPTSKASFTFGLWPADINSWFILDDATVGKLDTGKLAY